MNIPVFQVDAFTGELFGGNPAAICPLTGWLPDQIMQQIAAENNLAETAFFVPREEDFELRWFTPEVEVDLCGHATLAAAHILFTALNYSRPAIRFHTLKAGVLTVSRDGDRYSLDFPAWTPQPTSLPDGLSEAIGMEPVEILKSRDYLMVYESEEDVRSLRPDFKALAAFPVLGFIATAPGDDHDFVSRFFAPGAGIDEDPVTGSAHCSLTPYWAQRLGKTSLHAQQISRRRGELWCAFKGDRVLIAGEARTFLQGTIMLDSSN